MDVPHVMKVDVALHTMIAGMASHALMVCVVVHVIVGMAARMMVCVPVHVMVGVAVRVIMNLAAHVMAGIPSHVMVGVVVHIMVGVAAHAMVGVVPHMMMVGIKGKASSNKSLYSYQLNHTSPLGQ